MGRDSLALAARLEDGDRDLLRRQLRDQGLVVVGDEPAGGSELDPVRAGAQRRAHDVPHLLRAVDEMRRPARIDRRQRPLEARASEVGVAVAAGLADEDDRDLQSRPGRVAGGERVAQAAIGAGEVADERDARFEGHACVPGRLERPPRDRRRQAQPPGPRSRT